MKFGVEKWSLFFVLVLGSAVSEILRFARFYVKTAKTDQVANFVELGHVETCSASYGFPTVPSVLTVR